MLPSILGGLASWTFRSESGWSAAGIGALAAVLASFSLLFVAVEGLGCILMCIPIVAPSGALGGWFVYNALRSRTDPRTGVALLILPFATLTFDLKMPPPVFKVHSEVVVNAAPEQVWKHVVTFSELPEPDEWFFRAGLAYPKRAHIVGSGPGAIRYCEFSTGPFVEPIETWDEPRLLAFNVTQNPAPMNEWSPYKNVLPKHLHGYFISKHGEFRLTPLGAGGRALKELRGTNMACGRPILAMVVRCDYSSDSPAGPESCKDPGGSGLRANVRKRSLGPRLTGRVHISPIAYIAVTSPAGKSEKADRSTPPLPAGLCLSLIVRIAVTSPAGDGGVQCPLFTQARNGGVERRPFSYRLLTGRAG